MKNKYGSYLNLYNHFFHSSKTFSFTLLKNYLKINLGTNFDTIKRHIVHIVTPKYIQNNYITLSGFRLRNILRNMRNILYLRKVLQPGKLSQSFL